MNFKSVSDSTLLSDTKRFALSERQNGIDVLYRLREIDARKLFASLGFSSLFGYCTRELGYSEGAACRRIQAMRLLRELPEMEAKLEGGLVNETQLSKVRSFFKGKEYSKREKLELLRAVEGKSSKQTEQLLAEKAPEAAKPEKAKPINENETEIRFTANRELMEKLEKLRDQLGHAKYGDLIENLADLALKKLEPQLPPPAAVELPTSDTRYVPKKVKVAVWKRDGGRCTFTTPDGKRCDSRHALQLEHAKPFAQGGKTSFENLKLLCPGHNQFSAIQAYGLEKMRKYWLK